MAGYLEYIYSSSLKGRDHLFRFHSEALPLRNWVNSPSVLHFGLEASDGPDWTYRLRINPLHCATGRNHFPLVDFQAFDDSTDRQSLQQKLASATNEGTRPVRSRQLAS